MSRTGRREFNQTSEPDFLAQVLPQLEVQSVNVFAKQQIPEAPPNRTPDAGKVRLRKFFAQFWVEVTIGVLVLVSVALTLLEFAMEVRLQDVNFTSLPLLGTVNHYHLLYVMIINDVITLVFVVELMLRYFAATSKRRFFSEFWLDILATVPLFRVFRSARALRLLRLIRIVRLLGVFSRVSSHYPQVLKRGAVEFLVICSFLFIAILFGTAAMTYFEQVAAPAHPNPIVADAEAPPVVNEFSLENSFWFSIYTLFAGEPVPSIPKTITGKVISVFLMFLGLTVFAIIAGTVSAFMSDRIRLEARIVEWDDLSDHIIICGWTPKTETIIREYRANKRTRSTPIVIISQLEHEQTEVLTDELSRVYFVEDDFTKISALKRAGIERAQMCLVLADLSGGRSEQDADARTILASLSCEKINPGVYTCAELINRNYSSHLELGHVNNYIVSEEYGAYMLAQASLHEGLSSVMNELLSYQHGNEFYRAEIPASWVGRGFGEMLVELSDTKGAILIGVHPYQGEVQINPVNYVFHEKDEVVAISRGGLDLSE